MSTTQALMYWKCWSRWTLSRISEKGFGRSRASSGYTGKSDLEGRLDLREEITFTIDGQMPGRAVHIKRLKNGNFELGVHIADVSYGKALSWTRKPLIGQHGPM